MESIVSVHDVMPETWQNVQYIIQYLLLCQVTHMTLLVVPGKNWKSEHVNQLRQYSDCGIELAGHGWSHQVGEYGGLYHRLHALLLSRHSAEHLALTSAEIASLISRCHGWFFDQALPQPKLYVAPAWAMGSITRTKLATLPFRYYEYLTGIYDSHSNRFLRLPVLGYQADHFLRVPALWSANILSHLSVHFTRSMVRIAIHPGDLGLKLANGIDRDLRRTTRFLAYQRIGES